MTLKRSIALMVGALVVGALPTLVAAELTRRTQMPDLKLTSKAAKAAIDRAREDGVRSIETTAERLTNELQEVAAVRALPVPTYDSADIAATVDLQLGRLSSAPQIGLNIGGMYGGAFTQLATIPVEGRYRVLILFTKLPDK